MDKQWELLEKGNTISHDCDGQHITIAFGKTSENSEIDVTWPNGKPHITIADSKFCPMRHTDMTHKEFKKLLDELPRILQQAEAIREK